MAREKEKIQREWDAAQTQLTTAISTVERALESKTVTERMVRDVGTKYEAWKELLDEAVEKIGGWKKEKDAKRLEWMRFVNTQSTKTDKNFVTKIERLKEDAGGVMALIELIDQLKNEGVIKLRKVREKYEDALRAITEANAAKAIKGQGIALNLLKGVSPLAKMSTLKKQAGNWARGKGVPAKAVNLQDPELIRLFEQVSGEFDTLNQEINDLEGEIDRLTEELTQQDPESTNVSASVEYKANLKKCVQNYKGVADFAKQGLAKAKKSQGNLKKLASILARTTAGNAVAVVPAIVQLHAVMHETYSSVDSHIQANIRMSDSTFSKQATDWGITTDDRVKSLGPMQDRAFAINYQIKEIVVGGTDKLTAMLQELVDKFNCEEARTALARIE